MCPPITLDPSARNLGTFLKLPSTQAVEVLAAAGFDFCVVDLEHSLLDEGDGLRLLAHAAALGFPAVVRIAELDKGLVNRALEAGAVGIQLSTVRRAAQVRELRAATRYSPGGNRSFSLGNRAGDFGATASADYLAAQERRPPLVIAQIETAATDDTLAEIVAAGPDVVFIGTADLSVDVGPDREAFAARVAEICDAVIAGGVVLGGLAIDDPRSTYRISSSDLSMLRGAAGSVVDAERERP